MFPDCSPNVLGASTIKVCKSCGEAKPLTEYSPARKCIFGVKAKCKQCAAAKQRTYYKDHRDDCLETIRQWSLKNPEKVRGYKQKHAEATREKHNEDNRSRYASSPEYKAAVNSRSEKWKHSHRDKVRAAQNRRRKSNPEQHALYQHARRARKLGNGGAYTVEDVAIQALGQTDKAGRVRCWICGKPMPDNDQTIDHFIPLSKGGTNGPGNIRLAHMRCNSRKSNKHPYELGRLV